MREDSWPVGELQQRTQELLGGLLDTVLSPVSALKCEMACEVLRSSGKLRLQVTGCSMLPTIWPGDTLLVESTSTNAVCAGEIVLFGRDRRLFAHRVVSKDFCESTEVVTRGDAMQVPDPVVSENEFLGKVSYIVRNGKCIRPRRELRSAERALATLMQRSDLAARVAVGVHGWLRESIKENRI